MYSSQQCQFPFPLAVAVPQAPAMCAQGVNAATQWQSSQHVAYAPTSVALDVSPRMYYLVPVLTEPGLPMNSFLANPGVSVAWVPQQAVSPLAPLGSDYWGNQCHTPWHASVEFGTSVDGDCISERPFPVPQGPVGQDRWSCAGTILNLPSVTQTAPEESGFCTPEFTPRCIPERTPPPASAHCGFVSVNGLPQAVDRDGACIRACADLDVEESRDGFSEFGSQGDEQEQELVCWDFDIHAALLIRAQRDRDSNGYASSDTSTAVSRSSRRRRGRRLAKSKVKSSIQISEAPAAHELIITEDDKVKVVQRLEAGGNEMHKSVASLVGSVLRMSLEPYGCRVVQSALDAATMPEKEALVAELRGHVRLMVSSPHANFVIQKVIEVLPVASTSFVADELKTFAADVAQHRFGCRVLSRLIEHHLGSDVSANALIDELLLQVDQLIRSNFARHVLELILEHGTEHHKHQIASAIQSNAFYYGKNRCASYVIEKAFAFCSESDVRAFASELLSDHERFVALAGHECGMHVIKAVVMSRTDSARKAREVLQDQVDRVKSSKYGARLLDEI